MGVMYERSLRSGNVKIDPGMLKPVTNIVNEDTSGRDKRNAKNQSRWEFWVVGIDPTNPQTDRENIIPPTLLFLERKRRRDNRSQPDLVKTVNASRSLSRSSAGFVWLRGHPYKDVK